MSELITLAENQRDGTLVKRVGTFADLRNYEPTVDKETITLLGGATLGDVNAGSFRYDPISVLADDSLNTIVTVGGKRWRRLQLAYASLAQGSKADSALQPLDNVSELANDADYATGADLLDLVPEWQEDISQALAATGAPVLISTTAITAVTSIDLATIFSDNSEYSYFRCVVEGMAPVSGARTLDIRVSVDGATFAATDYEFVWSALESNEAAPLYTKQEAGTAVSLGTSFAVGDSGIIAADFHDVVSGTTYKGIAYSGRFTAVTRVRNITGVGMYRGATTALTGIQLRWSDGVAFNVAGTVKVYGSNSPF